jgi:uncharacterized membrane protein YfcA
VIAAVLLGLVIGVALGALGGGGSVLAVPVLVHLAGQTAAAATATSLVAVGAAAVVGTVGHAHAGRVRWGAAAAFIATGVPGSWVGATLNERLDGDVLLLAFSVVVLVAAQRMLTACPSCTREGEETAIAEERPAPPAASTSGGTSQVLAPARPTATARSLGRLVLAGSVVGFLTGLFGVGGGFVIVPALTLGLGLSLPVAVGTSLAVIVGNAAVALGFRGVDAVDWDIAVPFAATMLIGTAVGSAVATRLPARRSLHAFAILLVAVAVANGAAAIVALVG